MLNMKNLKKSRLLIPLIFAAMVIVVLSVFSFGYYLGTPKLEQKSESVSGIEIYTCSMHPSVRLQDPKAKCPICFMDLIPAPKDGGESKVQLSISDSAAELSQISTARVVQFYPTTEIRLFGKLTYDETAVSRLTAYYPGRINRLFVNFLGASINKGEHVAEMFSPELLAALEELKQAKKSFDASSSASTAVKKSAESVLHASRERLRLFGLQRSQIKLAEEGKANQDSLTLYSPLNGVVTKLDVKEGDYLRIGQSIATVANLSRLWLDMEAYESQLPLLRWGQQVEFQVESVPGRKFEGKIVFVEPFVDESTRTAAVRVAVDNAHGMLKPGMFASGAVLSRVSAHRSLPAVDLAGHWVSTMHPTIVKDHAGQCDVCGMELVPAESLGLLGDSTKDIKPMVIPRSAVLFTGKRSLVYVKLPGKEKPTYESRVVVLGLRAGEFYTVVSGLELGEEVVVHGAFRVDSAMQISAKPSMMNFAGEETSKNSYRPQLKDFVLSLKPLYGSYLRAQIALADDDLESFSQIAEDLKSALGYVATEQLGGKELEVWRKILAKFNSSDAFEDLSIARSVFEDWSFGVLELEMTFGHLGKATWHQAYCPMAFDNKGASWLQRDGETISNPYFGASMLRCGSFKAEFKPIDSETRPGGGK